MARMKFDVDHVSGCHVWAKARNSRGYGVIWHDGKVRLAHRVAFLFDRGRWPNEGLVVDHICENKACVNPDHLREVENWQNVRRASRSTTPINQLEYWRKYSRDRRGTYSDTYTPGGDQYHLVQS